MNKGYTLTINNTNYFFVTDKKTITSKLVKQVKETLQQDNNLTPTITFSLRSKLKPAELDASCTNFKVVVIN